MATKRGTLQSSRAVSERAESDDMTTLRGFFCTSLLPKGGGREAAACDFASAAAVMMMVSSVGLRGGDKMRRRAPATESHFPVTSCRY